MFSSKGDPLLPQALEVRKRQHVRQPQGLDLGQLGLVLRQPAHHLGMLKQIGGFVGRAVRIDGRADRADEREREVEERPLEGRLPDDRERVAFRDAEREQYVGELVHGSRRLAPRDFSPPPGLDLREIRGIVASGRSRVAPKAHDRSLTAGSQAKNSTGGIQAVSANSLHPSTIGWSAS